MVPDSGGKMERKGLNPGKMNRRARAASPCFPQKPEWKRCFLSLRVVHNNTLV